MAEQRLIDANELMRCMGVENAVKYGNRTEEERRYSYNTLMRYEIADAINDAPTIDAVPVVHARWTLEESPYAEHEEAVDGESHPRYVCSNCRSEAGFTCDPDGFAGEQELNDWCSNCGAKMDGGAEK